LNERTSVEEACCTTICPLVLVNKLDRVFSCHDPCSGVRLLIRSHHIIHVVVFPPPVRPGTSNRPLACAQIVDLSVNPNLSSRVEMRSHQKAETHLLRMSVVDDKRLSARGPPPYGAWSARSLSSSNSSFCLLVDEASAIFPTCCSVHSPRPR